MHGIHNAYICTLNIYTGTVYIFIVYVYASMRAGKNAFDGYTPSVPQGEKLDWASPAFLELEEAGLEEAASAAFVLVAGACTCYDCMQE